jgi:Na+/melibiose symporter-like transporter
MAVVHDLKRARAALMARKGPGWGLLAIYSIPALGVAAPAQFVQFYFLNFATDALLLAPAVVGIILALGRIWDAVSDPIVGYGSDLTQSRWGRRRPWMALAAPATVVSFAALWSPPGALESKEALTLWSAGFLFLFTTAFTAWAIPHQALGVELSDDAHARTRIFGVRFIVALVGTALAFGAMQLIGSADDPRAMARNIAWMASPTLLALLILPVLAISERPDFQGRELANPWEASRQVARNGHARRLLGIWFLAQLGLVSLGVTAPYMATYVLKRPDLIAVIAALFIGPLICSVPLWILWAGRYGRRRMWLWSMIGASASYTLLALMPVDDFRVIGLLLATAGFFSGCLGPVGPSFIASLVDEDEKQTGERREGVYFSAKEFVEKASGAAVVLVVGMTLQWVGFEPNVAQSREAEWAIRACMGFLPGAAMLLGAWLLRGLDLE